MTDLFCTTVTHHEIHISYDIQKWIPPCFKTDIFNFWGCSFSWRHWSHAEMWQLMQKTPRRWEVIFQVNFWNKYSYFWNKHFLFWKKHVIVWSSIPKLEQITTVCLTVLGGWLGWFVSVTCFHLFFCQWVFVWISFHLIFSHQTFFIFVFFWSHILTFVNFFSIFCTTCGQKIVSKVGIARAWSDVLLVWPVMTILEKCWCGKGKVEVPLPATPAMQHSPPMVSPVCVYFLLHYLIHLFLHLCCFFSCFFWLSNYFSSMYYLLSFGIK